MVSYPYAENFRYTFQRWTGVIAFAFILWHVFQTRGWINNWPWWLENVTRTLGGGMFDRKQAVKTGIKAVQQAAWEEPSTRSASGLGLPLANGLWTIGIPGARGPAPGARWATVFCAAFGLALAGAGLAALYGFWFIPSLKRKKTSWQNHR